MNRLILILFFCIACISRAQNTKGLTVHFINGMSLSFLLSKEPKLSIDGSDLIVSSSNLESVSLPLNKLDYFVIEEVIANAIDELTPTASFHVGVDGIKAYGLQSGMEVQAYKLDGTLVARCVADTDGCAMLRLAQGLYIIKMNNQSIKVLIK